MLMQVKHENEWMYAGFSPRKDGQPLWSKGTHFLTLSMSRATEFNSREDMERVAREIWGSYEVRRAYA